MKELTYHRNGDYLLPNLDARRLQEWRETSLFK
jgi:hypothetical protein